MMLFSTFSPGYVPGRLGNRPPAKLVAVLAFIFLFTHFAPAQRGGGEIKGQVRDTQGASLPGVVVALRHESKGVTRTSVTNERGDYFLSALPIGSYTVTFSLDGFQAVVEKEVIVALGNATVLEAVLQASDLSISEEVLVTGGQLKSFDITSTTTGLAMATDDLEKLPVRNGSTAVALLAPGTTQGDSDFGNLASFGGSSVAENGYFLNGLNVTNIRKGIGSVRFPWEAVDQVQVKTGGTPAEFGRHIGGVVNMETKSGTNEFRYGLRTVWDPESLQARQPTIFFPDSNGEEQLQINHSEDSSQWQDLNAFVSGPIVENRAFFYVLYNPRRWEETYAGRSSYTRNESDGDFWLAKLDWFLGDHHSLELLAFNNELEGKAQSYNYDYQAGQGDFIGNTYFKTGGDVWTLKYHGRLSDEVSLSASYGETDYLDDESADNTELPAIWDSRSGSWIRLGDWVADSITHSLDERVNYRVDMDWVKGAHSFRIGVDAEENDIFDTTTQTGDGYYLYFRAEADNPYGLPEGTDYVDRRVFVRGGTSTTISRSWYVQDTWNLTHALTLNLGVRNTTFENTTSDDQTYVDIDNQIAPRLGVSWDVGGHGNNKLYAFYGRFFMPVAANTNVRMASGEVDEHFINYLLDVNADGSPVLGAQIDHQVVQNGQVPDADRLFNRQAGPMYSDEYLLGYETKLQNSWKVGTRATYRDLLQSIEDVSINYALNDWIDANFPGADHVGGWFPVLTNPGRDVTIPYDVNGDGVPEDITLTAENLGFPKSRRKYWAVELNAEGAFNERLWLSASYTWSHNYGNTEGLLRSDNNQTDPGWTTSFDYPELMEHGWGDLPNDRRHQLKTFGSYGLTKNLALGFFGSAVSGRPRNSFGVHPGTDCNGDCYGRIWYGALSFYTDGKPMPRGSAGRTPWVYNLDLNLNYNLPMSGGRFSVKADLFNVFNWDSATELEEYAEFDSGANRAYYGQPTRFQSPRSFRLTIRYEF